MLIVRVFSYISVAKLLTNLFVVFWWTSMAKTCCKRSPQ